MRPYQLRAAGCLLLLAGCMPASASQYDPHPPTPSVTSWFEGWYIRLTPDRQGSAAAAADKPGRPKCDLPASLSLIVGTQPNAPSDWTSTMMSLTVQSSSPSKPVPTEYTHSDMALSITGPGGVPVASNPSFSSPPSLTIAAADGSLMLKMDGDSCHLSAHFKKGEGDEEVSGGEEAHLEAECVGPPMLWDHSGSGPEGRAARIPTTVTGLHWFVHSLATPMRFTLTQGNRSAVHGHALAHWEKNWGHGFPLGWYWAQGVNASSTGCDGDARGSCSGDAGKEGRARSSMQAAFALAGGQAPSPFVPEGWMPDAWLLGVRTPNYSWDLHAYDSVFTAQADPCQATLLLTATQPLARRAVDVQITARPASFASLEGPTKEGFKHYLDESIGAYATVRLFELRLAPGEPGWVKKILLEAWEFPVAALEFGGDRRCSAAQAMGADALKRTAGESVEAEEVAVAAA